MNKRYVIFGAAVASIFLIQKTQAYLTDQKEVSNLVRPGYNRTEITENFPPVTPTPLVQNPTYVKNVQVVNSPEQGNVPCYVRIRLLYSDDDVGRAVRLLDMDQINWSYSPGDGFYYYKHILNPGESTTSLFQKVQLQDALTEKTYQENIPYLDLEVYEESVQADVFADYLSAWSYHCSALGSV